MSGPRLVPARRLVGGALAALVATVLAGCSGGGAASSQGDEAAYGNEEVIEAMGAAVAAQESVKLTLGTAESPDDITFTTSWGEEPVFRAVTGGDPAQQLDVRRLGARVYLGGELVGHQWTYLEVDDPRLVDPESDFDAGPVPTLLDIDVVDDLAALEAAVTGVEPAGNEEVDGVATDHYTLTVDSQKWFDGLGEDSMYRQMTLPETLTMELYLDEESLPVRLSYANPDEKTESAEVGYEEWGTPVKVTVPPRARPVS